MASRAFAALAAILAAGCEGPHATPCEGEVAGTFSFQAVPQDGGSCPFGAGPTSFRGTVSYLADGGALLCIDRPEAAPLSGAHTGDHVTVASGKATANVSACACATTVTETVDGDLVRADGGAVSFQGTLRDQVDPVADGGAACEPDGGSAAAARCGVPCDLRWTLTGS